jgi:hypothetical protein
MRLACAVRSGRVVSLARAAVADPTASASSATRCSAFDPQPEESGCIEEIGMIYHGFNVTHLMRSAILHAGRSA